MKWKWIKVRWPKKQYDAIKREAKLRGLSFSDYVAEILDIDALKRKLNSPS